MTKSEPEALVLTDAPSLETIFRHLCNIGHIDPVYDAWIGVGCQLFAVRVTGLSLVEQQGKSTTWDVYVEVHRDIEREARKTVGLAWLKPYIGPNRTMRLRCTFSPDQGGPLSPYDDLHAFTVGAYRCSGVLYPAPQG